MVGRQKGQNGLQGMGVLRLDRPTQFAAILHNYRANIHLILNPCGFYIISQITEAGEPVFGFQL